MQVCCLSTALNIRILRVSRDFNIPNLQKSATVCDIPDIASQLRRADLSSAHWHQSALTVRKNKKYWGSNWRGNQNLNNLHFLTAQSSWILTVWIHLCLWPGFPETLFPDASRSPLSILYFAWKKMREYGAVRVGLLQKLKNCMLWNE